MRVFLLSVVAVPLLAIDGVLLCTFPARAAGLTGRWEWTLMAGGAAAYAFIHFFLRKPERMYLWGHEFSHLLAAKLFLRRVHSFHISSREGGKVVIDRTNVAIDLAPYVLPFYPATAGIAAAAIGTISPWIGRAYPAAASFLFAMHLVFSAEGFLDGQPDLKRSGRIFSAGIVLLCLILWVPLLAAPGTGAGWKGAAEAYAVWFGDAAGAVRDLLRFVTSFISPT